MGQGAAQADEKRPPSALSLSKALRRASSLEAPRPFSSDDVIPRKYFLG